MQQDTELELGGGIVKTDSGEYQAILEMDVKDKLTGAVIVSYRFTPLKAISVAERFITTAHEAVRDRDFFLYTMKACMEAGATQEEAEAAATANTARFRASATTLVEEALNEWVKKGLKDENERRQQTDITG